MTEPNATADLTLSSSPQRTLQNKPSSRWKKAALAGLLSLFVAGEGQLYNRQPRKAIGLALTIPTLLILAAKTRIFFSFFTMVSFFIVLIGWRLFITADAAYNAWTAKKPEAAVARPGFTYPVIAVTLLIAAFYPSYEDFKRWTSFAAFKVPSASMCPTICSGERAVADTGAYKSKPPQRGNLILLKHPSSPGLFIKRVIGLPGDVVTPGAKGTILINGKPLIPPETCGIPIQQPENPDDYPMFESTKVREGTFFVVGDNLGQSFDSRIPEFGPVVPDMVRGKPLFLYWSPGHSRLGCRTR
jgi:signal peptidase I